MGAGGPIPLRLVPGRGIVQPVGSAAAEVQPRMPAMPGGVAADPEMKEAWEEIVPGLHEAGLTSAADTAVIETMIRHLVVVRKAHRELMAADSITVEADTEDPARGSKKHPAEAIFRMESAVFAAYAKELGMTWMSRARTTIRKPEADGGNPFEPSASASG